MQTAKFKETVKTDIRKFLAEDRGYRHGVAMSVTQPLEPSESMLLTGQIQILNKIQRLCNALVMLPTLWQTKEATTVQGSPVQGDRRS